MKEGGDEGGGRDERRIESRGQNQVNHIRPYIKLFQIVLTKKAENVLKL